MKSLITVVLWAALAQPWGFISPTTFTKEIKAERFETIAIESTWGDVKIEMTDGQDVEITGEVVINGTLMNDRIEIKESKKGNQLSIDLEVDLEGTDKVVYLRDEDGNYSYIKSDKFDHANGWNGYQSMNYGRHVEAEFVIGIPKGKVLNIETVYGCISSDNLPSESIVHATYGSIDLKLPKFSSDSNYEIRSIYGHVDVAVPNKLNSQLNMSTSYGEIYSDLDIKLSNNKSNQKSCGFGEDIDIVMGAGLAKLNLEATYDNIYLRAL